MIKKAFILLTSFLAAALLCACAPQAAFTDNTPAPINEWTVTEGITLRLIQDEYPVNTKEMTIIMENRSDQVMLYGNGWSFERWEGGTWQVFENREDTAFTSEGYVLQDHDNATFRVSTFALKEPLKEGLYRVTGCTLRVAKSDANLSHGGDYTDYPPYQLEFLIKEDAKAEPAMPETETPAGALPEKEDWQWYTVYDGIWLYESAGQTVWQYVQDGHGLVAMLMRENTPENEMLEQGDLLDLILFDRQTGETFLAFDTPSVTNGDILPSEQGGFWVTSASHEYFAGQLEGEWIVERQCRSAAADSMSYTN